MSKKFAFTGQNGDIGSILFKKLSLLGANCVDFNKDQKDVDILLHIAAKSPPATNDEIIESNIVYLQKVANEAKKNGIKNIIFFSAISSYGTQNKEDLNESDSINNPSFYGLSKLVGEKYLSECGINTLALRLPAVLGYKNRTNFLARIYEKCENNETIDLSNANRIFNNFIAVDSLASFILRVKIRDGFDVINLASNKELTIKDVANTIIAELNSKSKLNILDKDSDFFNICTKKAELEYSFNPQNAKNAIINWIRERKIYEQS